MPIRRQDRSKLPARAAGPGSAWPALGHEMLEWHLPQAASASRADRRRHDAAYRAAVAPDIADRRVELPGELTAAVDDASSEIARFDAVMGGEIAPFSAILLRSESAASSRIENLTASARAIAEAELGASHRSNAAEIVANTRTMTAALSLADRMDGDSILAMHRALLKESDPANAGRWRTEQVWIGGSHLGPHLATFVPPRHERVPAAIDDLVRFVARADVSVLVHAAIAHAQFETIHPFIDGNGRTGRALVQAMLRRARLTRSVTVPVSAGLLADPEAYFAALTAYRAGDPTAIVDQFVRAAFRALANGRQLVDELRALRATWQEAVVARRDSAAWRLCDLLLRRPVVNARLVADELAIPAGNVHRYVQPLLAAGVLAEARDVIRHQVWRAPRVLAALDAFAARAGRRR